MKKTYINPRIRVVELECHNGIAESLNIQSGGFDPNQNAGARRERFNDWDEDDEW